MKKFIALMLSVITLLSVTVGLDFTASAEEEMTTLTLGSDVAGATDDDVFSYEIYVNGDWYESYAYDTNEEEHYFFGVIDIPADDYYTFEIPYGAEYQICRAPITKDGYEEIDYAEKSGTVEKYSYSEEYILDNEFVFNDLTEDEYNAKTDNGKNEVAFFYYDSKAKDIKQANELVTGKFYTESVTEETGYDLGYIEGTQAEIPVSLDITAKYNVRKPATSFGITTYYYTGKITLKAGDKVYEQEYTTIPASDVAAAKSNAITTITPVVRTYAAQALTDVATNKDASIFYADSLEAMLPIAKSLTTDTTDVKIVNNQTKLVEINPYQKVTVFYTKEANDMGEYVIFDGALVIEHEHDLAKVETIEPTCIDEGYDLYACTIENCPETEKRNIVPADVKNHLYSRPVSNNDSVSPTCTEAGKSASQTKTCEICGDKVIIKSEEIGARGHNKGLKPTEENRKDPTCTKNGSYDEVYYCTRSGCNFEISRETKEIEKLGHSYDDGKVTTKATCGKAGVKTFTCQTCGNKKTQTIKATGKHTYDKGKVTKKPTSSAQGTMTYTCTVCGAKKTEAIAKLQKASISSLTAQSKGFKATWKKVSSATGYQIQYSTSSKFSSPKVATIVKNSTVSKSVTKLKAKKKYYVRIRTYRMINGTKYYSAWSSSKTVTTKK